MTRFDRYLAFDILLIVVGWMLVVVGVWRLSSIAAMVLVGLSLIWLGLMRPPRRP